MKKKITLITLLIASTAISFAQKGETSLGLNMAYNTVLENTGLGLRFQYGLDDRIRVAPSFNYLFENHNKSLFEVNADIHYLFPLDYNLRLYPLVGLNYTNIDFKNSGGSDSGFGANVGIGIEFPLTGQISMGTEFKRSVLFDMTDQESICFSMSYKF